MDVTKVKSRGFFFLFFLFFFFRTKNLQSGEHQHHQEERIGRKTNEEGKFTEEESLMLSARESCLVSHPSITSFLLLLLPQRLSFQPSTATDSTLTPRSAFTSCPSALWRATRVAAAHHRQGSRPRPPPLSCLL